MLWDSYHQFLSVRALQRPLFLTGQTSDALRYTHFLCLFPVSLPTLLFFFVTYSMFAVPRVLNLFSISSVKLETMDTNIFGCLYYILFYGIYYLSVTCLYSAILNVLPVYPLDMGDTLYMCAPLNWQDALRNNELFITLGLFILNFLVLSAPRGLFYIITVPVRNGFLWIVSLICGVPFT